MPNQTKQAIRQSFIKLLNERSFDKISIKDIVEDCNINRNTFYYHYQDIFDLIEDILNTEAEKVLGQGRDLTTWQEDFIVSTQFALENKKAIYHLHNSRHHQELERYFLKLADDLMLRFVKQQAKDLSVPEEDVRLLAAFYKHGVVGLLFDWMEQGMREDPQLVIRRIGFLLDGNIRGSLEKATEQAAKK